jgi:hypothetical protein
MAPFDGGPRAAVRPVAFSLNVGQLPTGRLLVRGIRPGALMLFIAQQSRAVRGHMSGPAARDAGGVEGVMAGAGHRVSNVDQTPAGVGHHLHVEPALVVLVGEHVHLGTRARRHAASVQQASDARCAELDAALTRLGYDAPDLGTLDQALLYIDGALTHLMTAARCCRDEADRAAWRRWSKSMAAEEDHAYAEDGW